MITQDKITNIFCTLDESKVNLYPLPASVVGTVKRRFPMVKS